jgi:hypothetical protein
MLPGYVSEEFPPAEAMRSEQEDHECAHLLVNCRYWRTGLLGRPYCGIHGNHAGRGFGCVTWLEPLNKSVKCL